MEARWGVADQRRPPRPATPRGVDGFRIERFREDVRRVVHEHMASAGIRRVHRIPASGRAHRMRDPLTSHRPRDEAMRSRPEAWSPLDSARVLGVYTRDARGPRVHRAEGGDLVHPGSWRRRRQPRPGAIPSSPGPAPSVHHRASAGRLARPGGEVAHGHKMTAAFQRRTCSAAAGSRESLLGDGVRRGRPAMAAMAAATPYLRALQDGEAADSAKARTHRRAAPPHAVSHGFPSRGGGRAHAAPPSRSSTTGYCAGP